MIEPAKPLWLAKGSEVVIYRDGPGGFVRPGTVTRVYDRSVKVTDLHGADMTFDIGTLTERRRAGNTWIQHFTRIGKPDDPRALRLAAMMKIKNHVHTLEKWASRQPAEALDDEAVSAAEELALLIPAFVKSKKK